MSVPVALRPRRALGRTQELIWASQRLFPDVAVANTANLYRIDGPLDPDRFVAAFDTVVRASEALRTVVVDIDGAPHPRLLGHGPAVTDVVELDAGATLAWAQQRVSVPLRMDRANYDSVLVRHGPESWSWLLNLHHLIVDAWGATLLYRATATAYFEGAVTLPSMTEHLATVDAQRSSDSWQRAAAHWRERERAPRPSSFYRRAPATTSSHRVPVPFGAHHRAALQRLLTEDLRPLSTDLGTVAVMATATFAYLAALSDERRLRLAVPVHHRRDAVARATPGLLMELFPLDVTVEADETFRSLYGKVTRGLFDLLRFAEPASSARPDADVVLNVITASSGPFGPWPAQATWVHSGHVDPAHTLRVQYFDFTGDGQPTLAMDLNDAVADEEQRGWAAGHLLTVLEHLLHDPDAPIARCELVGPEERVQLVERFNAPAHATDGDAADGDATDGDATDGDAADAARSGGGTAAITAALAALRHHGGTALVDGELTLDGDEVAARIDAAARALLAQGIGRGHRVGIRIARSAEAVLAIHAVLRAGASFVPLDPDYPPARLQHIIDDAGLALVLDAVPSGTEHDPTAPCDPRAAAEGAAALPRPDLDDEAYVLYTSGSTGLPKGVPISHRGLAGYLDFARAAYLDPAEAPVVALCTSLSFDLTVTSLFLPWLVGGTLVIFGGDGAAAIAAVARHEAITFLKATPSHLELFERIVGPGHGLRRLVVGGEAFARHLADRLTARLPGVAIYNEYGPTESVVGCMVHRYDPAHDDGADVPIGRPAPDVRLFVLDPAGNLAPRGVPGELYIARPGQCTGYLDRPELNQERFVALERFGVSSAYRSGDLVRFRDEHTLEYLGRLDEQLKLNGVRLEPAEVEAALCEHPQVTQAIVRLWAPAEGGAVAHRCVRCGLGSDVPGITFDDDEVCSACRQYDAVRRQAEQYFGDEADLHAARERARGRRRGRYDVLHLLSGGKDSTYALYRLVELGFEVRSFTLDNGFISEQAKDNIRRVVSDLGVDHDFATTDAMDEIFRDSLERFSNVCNGCYKTIYTLSINRAHELGIPMIVTGLSRGQFFETRLTPGQFALERFDVAAIDAAVLEARKRYHRTDDAVSRLLDVSLFDDDGIFEEIEFLDFYRYEDVELADLLAFLDARAPWVRPTDTGRSTNCLINAAGIAVHKLERGFHNYAVPYSWDVRVGHKQRDEALEELDDPLDADEVSRCLDAVRYQPRSRQILTAWYSTDEVPALDLDPDQLRRHLAERVPGHAVPAAFVRIGEVPLSPNGKLETAALPAPTRRHRDASSGYLPPVGPVEETLCELWAEVLEVDRVGAEDDFFELGGTSRDALEMVVRCSETYEVHIPEDRAFTRRTVRELAADIEALVLAAIEALPETDPTQTDPTQTDPTQTDVTATGSG